MYTAVHFCTEKRQTKPLVILAMPQESRPTPPSPPGPTLLNPAQKQRWFLLREINDFHINSTATRIHI